MKNTESGKVGKKEGFHFRPFSSRFSQMPKSLSATFSQNFYQFLNFFIISWETQNVKLREKL